MKTKTSSKKSVAKSRSSGKSNASVVPQKYRDRYEDGSCGDTLAKQLRAHVTTKDGAVDVAKLRALAKLNGVWKDSYSKLNNGLQRMTISNRLRALPKVIWSDRTSKKAA
jgi:hypothetical protein